MSDARPANHLAGDAEVSPPVRSVTAGLDSPRGWGVVGAAFVALLVVFGVMNSFGSFFGPMADEFGVGRGATAAMFSITTFVMSAAGLWSGRAADRHGPRVMIGLAAALMAAGLVATSQVGSIWAGYLTYGIGVGLAVGLAYVPAVAAVSGWFERRRALAVGIAVVGSGLGTVVFAPLTTALIEQYGWRDAYMSVGIGSAVTLAVCAMAMARPPTPAAGMVTAPSFGSLVRSRTFRMLYSMMLLMTLCLFVPLVFLKPYAESVGIGSTAASSLVSLFGVGSIVGRVVLGALGSRGPIALLQLSAWLLAGSFGLWLLAGASYPVLAVFAVLVGTGLGGFTALSPAVAVEVFGVAGLGGVLGVLYTSAGVGGLLGPAVAGVVADATSYRVMMVVSMSFGLVGAALITRLRRETTAPASNSVSSG
jgi:MFS family permease